MTFGKLTALFLCAALSSCALFESDPPRLVDTGVRTKTRMLPPSEPPAHFVVTRDEALLAVPISKYNWSIYADSRNYYLYPLIDVPTYTSSAAIREYGHPLSGTTRHDIDRIKALREKNRAAGRNPQLSPAQFEKALPGKHITTP